MKCLGVESTAHTFSCAVLERKGKRGEILSDVRKFMVHLMVRGFIQERHLGIMLKIVPQH